MVSRLEPRTPGPWIESRWGEFVFEKKVAIYASIGLICEETTCHLSFYNGSNHYTRVDIRHAFLEVDIMFSDIVGYFTCQVGISYNKLNGRGIFVFSLSNVKAKWRICHKKSNEIFINL